MPRRADLSRDVRNLVVVLGDQLSRSGSAWDGFDPAVDRVWMAEVSEESTHVWSAKQRTALFLTAMRHFAQSLRDDGIPLDYRELPPAGEPTTLGGELRATLAARRVQRVVLTEPGDLRVLQALRAAAGDVPLDVREDRHFLCSTPEFARWAEGRRQLRMEYFYRDLRRRHDVLMDGGEPAGGRWNFDAENRGAFGAAGPGPVPPTPRFAPDAITREVIDLVNVRFADHPGLLTSFGWPVTREQALEALAVFINERLEHFGRWQDAMWDGRALALPRAPLRRDEPQAAGPARGDRGRPRPPGARAARRSRPSRGSSARFSGGGSTCAASTGGRCRGYAELNALGAEEDLPAWYWTGETRDALPAGRHRPDAGVRLRPPHPAADGDGPLRAAARRGARAGPRLVSAPSTSMRSSGWSCRTRWA